jgi:hypothetical protein
MKLPSVCVIAFCVSLGGCVGRLQTTPYLEHTDKLSGALRGVTYSLPKLQYAVKLTRYLAECPGEVIDGEQTALKFAVNVEATPAYVPGEAYTIDYEKLSGFTRTSNFEIKYWPNGNLKSIGAGADDRTAEIVKDVVKTGLAIASATQGVPVVPRYTNFKSNFNFLETAPKAHVVCTPGTLALVQARRTAAKDVEDNTKALKALATAIERIEKRATLKIARLADREQLLDLFTSLDAEAAKTDALKKALAVATDRLGVSQQFVWDSRMDQAVSGQIAAYEFTPAEKAKLASLLQLGPLVHLTGASALAEVKRRALFPSCFAPSADPEACVTQQLVLRAAVAVQSLPDCPVAAGLECLAEVTAKSPRYQAARDMAADSGLFVREPAQGRLLFCRAAYDKCTVEVDEAKLAPTFFPQLGQLRYLPLRVGAFQAKDMALTMTEDGRLESFSYKSTKAPGQVLAAAAADIAGQVDSALEKRETERRDDLAYARAQETADVQSEITRLTKALELRKAQEALAPDPLRPVTDQTTALKADIALLEAQLAKLKAERALLEASASPAS